MAEVRRAAWARASSTCASARPIRCWKARSRPTRSASWRPRPACRRWRSTDRANLFGALEFSVATKDAGVQPIIGCALPVTGIGEGPPERWARTPTVVLLAQNEAGYRNLTALSSAAYPRHRRRPTSRTCPGTKVAAPRRGADPALRRPGRAGRSAVRRRPRGRGARRPWPRCSRVFGDRFYVELQRHGLAVEAAAEPGLVAWAYEHDVPLVATNDVYFADARPARGARRAAVHRRRRLPRPGRAAAGHRRALVQAAPTEMRAPVRRPAGGLRQHPRHRPPLRLHGRASAIRSCRASPPSAGRIGGRGTGRTRRARAWRCAWRRIAPAGAARPTTGSGWSARSASSSRWAFPATS